MLKKKKKIKKKKISARFPDTLPLGPQPAERLTRGAMRWYWTSLVDSPMLLCLLADGGGSSGRGQPAASPPFPAPPQIWRMAAGFGLQANGATPPLPLGRQPPLLVPGARQRAFRPTCSSIAPAPPPRAATGDLRFFLLPDLLSTAIPLSPSRMTATHKTQTKIQAWSSLVFHCCHSSFNPSEAPPWDSRPVSGAGVVHYQLLHRPRSVPTALGPAPLVTTSKTMKAGGWGWGAACYLLGTSGPSYCSRTCQLLVFRFPQKNNDSAPGHS